MIQIFVGLIFVLQAVNAANVDPKLLQKFARPSAVPYPEENPSTPAKQKLGKILFFDPRLSKAKNQSCVSCHHPGMGWEMGIPKAIGAGGTEKPMDRKAETLSNLAWSDSFFWDGRSETLEKQILTAFVGAKAMGLLGPDELVNRVKDIHGYLPLFKEAFGSTKVTQENIAMAIATYVRSLVSAQTAFDRWVAGDEKAISDKAKKGFAVFNGKGRCTLCHDGWNFTDNAFHDTGLSSTDIGRGKQFAKVASMQFAFKTPTLRNIAKRAPYFHDGSLVTLKDVVDFYDRGGDAKRESLSPDIKKLSLSRSEKESLIEFLGTLSSDEGNVTIPDMVF